MLLWFLLVNYHYINDKLHRIDGPAIIWYYENGNIEKEEYWINDIKLNEFQALVLKSSLIKVI